MSKADELEADVNKFLLSAAEAVRPHNADGELLLEPRHRNAAEALADAKLYGRFTISRRMTRAEADARYSVTPTTPPARS